jgi:hypothetical protein
MKPYGIRRGPTMAHASTCSAVGIVLGKLLLRRWLHYAGRHWIQPHRRRIDSPDGATRPNAR